MPRSTSTTPDRVRQAALDLFLQQGIRKTTIDDIAERAGVTRVTVYRHFGDRNDLIRAAFSKVNDDLASMAETLREEPNLDAYLGRMATELAVIPTGYLAGNAELATLHPGIHADLRIERRALLGSIFDDLYDRAEKEHRLRPGLDREIVEALFWEVVMGLPESPTLASLGLTTEEMYATLSTLLLHGLLER